MLSDKQILDFQNLYTKKYGIELSRDEAYEKAIRLVRIVELTYRPVKISKKDMENRLIRKIGCNANSK